MLSSGSELLGKPLAETRSEDLAQLFLRAAKPDTQWYVGTELELFCFHEHTREAAHHEIIRELLDTLADKLAMKREFEVNGALIGLKGEGSAASLEPGGQLEFASRPHRELKELRRELTVWATALSECGREQGLGFWALGHHPFVDRDSAPVMPKPRYSIMREHLRGSRGRDMMHLTGSVQVTVDFRDEINLVNKVRTAAKVSPFLSALVAASPFSSGRLNGYKSMRYQIWLDTDEARCGLWPEMVDEEGLTTQRYIERTLQTPAMFFRRDNNYLAADKTTSIAEYARNGFEGTTVTVADYVDHLTTFFPEIRPKGYVEMRGMDCVRPELAVAIAGFWRGILDDEATRQSVDERLRLMDFGALKTLQPEIARVGLEADSSAGPVADVVAWLVEAAHARLKSSAPDCAECVEPLLERARARRSPADDLIERAEKSSVIEALDLVRL